MSAVSAFSSGRLLGWPFLSEIPGANGRPPCGRVRPPALEVEWDPADTVPSWPLVWLMSCLDLPGWLFPLCLVSCRPPPSQACFWEVADKCFYRTKKTPAEFGLAEFLLVFSLLGRRGGHS